MTSSTSTQYSFENIYTRYIVEGLNTGAADRDEDGWISVDELHQYAKEKVQESVPAMKPEIYAIKEGYKIQLAKAPKDDPKLKYRQEVEYWSKQGGGEIIPLGRQTLNELRDSLGLTTDAAAAIEAKAIKMAAAAKKQNLKLFGSSTINTYQTLEQGQGIEGMIVAVPWNPTAGRGKSFAVNATKLWGKNVDWRSGNLTWRTAMAYDATQAIIQGIKTCDQTADKPSRECLKNDLARNEFSVDGVTGKVHFQGDRNGEVSLVQLKQINITVTGYDYVPFPLPK
ncbi:hypothetical protein [Microseira sp. BLCC-F43]|uniref:hypothetical protein n=1 Tax=Microseira sp. BLCC-F43 TaxID=3153602 RepID=UPI0035B774A3